MRFFLSHFALSLIFLSSPINSFANDHVINDCDTPCATLTLPVQKNPLLRNIVDDTLSNIDDALTGIGTVIDNILAPILGDDGILRGGTLSGLIQGDIDQPSWLEDVEILADSTLKNVIIGTGVILPEQFTLEDGVRFINSQLIPEALALTDSLPKVTLSELDDTIIQPLLIDMKSDPIIEGSGLLQRINALASLTTAELSLSQNTQGQLTLDIGDARYAVNPVEVLQSNIDPALSLLHGYLVEFNVSDNLKIQTQPALQDYAALRTALGEFGLDNFEIDKSGIIHVKVDEQRRFSLRPDWLSILALSTGNPLLAVAINYATLSFQDDNDNERLQRLFPAPADMGFLATAVEGLQLNDEGGISFTYQQQDYAGVLDFLVENDIANPITQLTIDVINQDEVEFLLRYPNGDQQRLFGF